MNIVDPGDTHVGSSDVEAASEKYSPLATAGARRPYSPPRLLSSEVRARRSSPGAAQRVDETRGPDQFGIPSNMFQDLLDSVVPGSVRVRKQ